MRLSEQEFLDLMGKKKVQRIILPVKMPTWNALLAMNHWQRKKVRDSIHSLVALVVSTSTTNANDLLTRTVYRLKLPLTDSFLLDYSRTIMPKSSINYRNRKKNQNKRKP